MVLSMVLINALVKLNFSLDSHPLLMWFLNHCKYDRGQSF